MFQVHGSAGNYAPEPWPAFVLKWLGREKGYTFWISEGEKNCYKSFVILQNGFDSFSTGEHEPGRTSTGTYI